VRPFRTLAAAGALLEALFPPACAVCGRSVDPAARPGGGGKADLSGGATPPLCPVCRIRLPRMAAPRCRRCGATRYLPDWDPESCPQCFSWPPELRRASAPCRMEGGAERLVHALKFEGHHALAPAMAREMVPEVRRLIPLEAERRGRVPVLVPVPLSPARRRERGFNQAELLARALSARLGWEVRDLLLRRPGGRRQARLGRRERSRNVEGRFRRRSSARLPAGEPPRVLLVDDVITTGATAVACARALATPPSGRAPGTAVATIEVNGVVAFARALQPIEER